MDFKNFWDLFFKKNKEKKNESNKNLFSLWVSDQLTELARLSLKSMLLTGHTVTLYTYGELYGVPDGINVADASKILDESHVFTYKDCWNTGSYAGFADWFRVKRLYEQGGSWVDCDVLAIKNINDVNTRDKIISSEYDQDMNIYPNNVFLRFEKKDKFLKNMLDYMEYVKDNVKHGDTGPILLKNRLDNEFKEYQNYLMNPNFIASINWFDYEDYLKSTKEILPRLNFKEIWGFHVWNSLYDHHNIKYEEIKEGFFYDLKEAIITNSTKDEYEEKINLLLNP